MPTPARIIWSPRLRAGENAAGPLTATHHEIEALK